MKKIISLFSNRRAEVTLLLLVAVVVVALYVLGVLLLWKYLPIWWPILKEALCFIGMFGAVVLMIDNLHSPSGKRYGGYVALR